MIINKVIINKINNNKHINIGVPLLGLAKSRYYWKLVRPGKRFSRMK